MEGYAAFKKLREETGYSLRMFSQKAEISTRALTYYENGQKSLLSMPTDKAIRIFEILKKDLPQFYCRFYPIKEEVIFYVNEYNLQHTTELNYKILYKRIYARIAKMKERGKITEDRADYLYKVFYDTFEFLKQNIDANGNILLSNYKKYVVDLLYLIKYENRIPDKLTVSGRIIDALYRSEYSPKNLADICGITVHHITSCQSGYYDISKMRIETALKMCLALNVRFYDIFNELDRKKT